MCLKALNDKKEKRKKDNLQLLHRNLVNLFC